jgi:YfiH family protein
MIIPQIFRPYLPEIFVGFTGVEENFSQRIPPELLEKNLQNFFSDHDIAPQKILNPQQKIHGVTIFSDKNFDPEHECDGVYTDKKNTLCMVKTADCIGAIFYHPQLKIGATIHAGWRGLAQKIFSAFLQKFSPAERKGFLVALSPSIGVCCSEFSDPYIETPKFFHRFIHKKSDKYFVDLWEIAKAELLEKNIPEKNIEMPVCCTKCQKNPLGEPFLENFWSHRNGDTQRNGTFFMRK